MYESSSLTLCAVGTDNTAPAFTDTQLGGLLASTSNRTNNLEGKQSSTLPYYSITQNTYTFAQGAVVGNVAEVGVGPAATSLFSRALIVDGSGNPTTITVLADEILVVEYELRLQVPQDDTTGTFTDGGTTYTWTARAANLGNSNIWSGRELGVLMKLNSTPGQKPEAYDGAIGTVFQLPSGASSSSGTVTTIAYTSGDYSASGSFVFSTGAANFGTGISAVSFYSATLNVCYQFSISPAIMKTSSDQLTFNISYSWGRA